MLHADSNLLAQLQSGPAQVMPVNPKQYDDEWLSLDLNVKQVANMDEAIDHIRTHGTQHSDAILTRSTCFTDGGQFGLGG